MDNPSFLWRHVAENTLRLFIKLPDKHIRIFNNIISLQTALEVALQTFLFSWFMNDPKYVLYLWGKTTTTSDVYVRDLQG